MNEGPKSSLNWALRAEAEESRRLARSLGDRQSVKDLKHYASELEAEAVRSQLERNLSPKTARKSEKCIVAPGRAERTQAARKNRGAH